MPRSSSPFVPGNTLSVGNKSHTGMYNVWDPSLCEKIVPLAEKGWSVAEICVELGFSKDSWYRWQEEHKEWTAAVKRATDSCEAWWIRYSREHLHENRDNKTNDKMWALNMMVRFGWAKKEETTVKGDLADAMKTMYDRLNGPTANPKGAGYADSPTVNASH